MRKLNTADVFALARIVRASGVRKDLVNLIQRLQQQDKPDLEAVGIEGMMVIMEAMAEPYAEQKIYTALSGPLEMDADDLSHLPPQEFFYLVQQLAKENDLQAFFSWVSGILGRK